MTRYIDEQKGSYGVEPICRTLQVAPSSYYAAKVRPPSARAVRDEVLATDIARILGDTLHNIRAALDHLIYQLADLDPDTPRGEKTQYPIFDTPDAFDAMPAYYLKGVPERYRAKVRMAQPYNPRYVTLEPLARLSNRDKHRVIDPIASSAVGMTLHADPPDAIYDIRGPDGVLYFVLYFDDRAVLATFRSDREVDVQIRDFKVAEILANFRAAFD